MLVREAYQIGWLGLRAYKVLARANIYSLEEAETVSDKDFLTMPNCGRLTVRQIREACEENKRRAPIRLPTPLPVIIKPGTMRAMALAGKHHRRFWR